MTDDGTVGLGQRFGNVEAALVRIEAKLDRKVDLEVHQSLVHRVEQLEAGDTPLGRVLLKQFENLQDQTNNLVVHGSLNAQEAVKNLAMLEERLDHVERNGVKGRAVLDDKQDRLIRAYRTWTLGFAALSILIAAISLIAHLH